ncbi:hypothetical protein DB354_20450 [Opitutus sp. ER46]|nr:hypothetical protein DB354_20450 [Opitutus sp. ER46]
MSSEAPPRHGTAARHIEHCAACQAHFARADAFTAALRRDASAHLADVPAGLDTRIMQAVTTSAVPAPARRKVRHLPGLLAGAAAGFVAVIAFIQTVDRPGPMDHEFTAMSPGGGAATAGTGSASGALNLESLTELAGPVKSALATDPLQTEVQSVYADARKAVHFLALNFLPSETASQPRNGSRPDA